MEDGINGRPVGSGVLVRVYKMPKRDSGLILTKDIENNFMPVVEIVKCGLKCVEAKPGQWASLIDGRVPNSLIINGESFALFKEYDFDYLYDTKPDFQEVMGSDTAITRDLTEYVKVEKMSKLRVKFDHVPPITGLDGKALM